MAYSNSHVHPLDQNFTLLLNTLQLDDFTDHYRGKVTLCDEVLYSLQSTRRCKINYLVKVAKEKDNDLKNFLWALKNSNQVLHKKLLEKLEGALKEISESRRETINDTDTIEMTRTLSSMSLDNYSRAIDVASDFTQVCCIGCISPINVIGNTADFMDVYKRTNPHGYVHRFYQLTGISTKCRMKREGKWHKEHSWFDQYWWMIIYCRDCDLHWGWHFENRDGSKSFYGIRKNAVCLHPNE